MNTVWNLQSEFEAIAAEVELSNRLGRLDKLCAEGVPARALPWTVSLQSEIQSEIVRAKRLEEERLRAILDAMTSDNDALEAEVAALDDAARRMCSAAAVLQASIGGKHA
jgi:hypothetical protein